MSYPPPPAQPPMAAAPTGKKPGRIPLRLALIFGVLGLAMIVVGAVLLVNGSLDKVNKFARVSVGGGGGTVHLSRTGKYVGYYETPSNANHHALVQMAMRSASGGEVKLHLYGRNSSLTYDTGGRHGEALFTFTIAKSGDYQVQVKADQAPAGAKVAFGESIAHNLVTGVLLVIPGVLLLVAAIILLIVGLVRRSRYNKRVRSGGYPAGPPPGYPPQGWPPPQEQPQQG